MSSRAHGPDRRIARGLLIGSADSAGAFAIMEYEIQPRTIVAPLHTHTSEDEYSYVLDGAVGAQIGAETCAAAAGELLIKPRRIPHTLWNAGAEPARVLEVVSPGGFERCLAELYRPGRPPPPQRLDALWREYGIEMDEGSLTRLMSTHVLERCALRL